MEILENKVFETRRKNPGRRGYDKETIVGDIRRAIEEGADSILKIEIKLGYSSLTIKRYASEAGVELPVGKRGRRKGKIPRPDITELAMRGLSLSEVGKRVGLSRERVRQIVESSGISKEYSEKRKKVKEELRAEKKQPERAFGEILWHLDRRAEELARQEGWAYEKAVEYVNKPTRIVRSKLRSHSFNDVLGIFQTYETAKSNGEKLSLKKLCEGTGFFLTQARKILNSVGVEPMHGTFDRHVTPKHKKEAIYRSTGVGMSNMDIAYFLWLKPHVVDQNLGRKGLSSKRPEIKGFIKKFGSGKEQKNLTYRLASEIYEACDAGFNLEETCELLDTTPEIVEYAIMNDGKIGEEIVKALRVLYDDESIDEPSRRRDF